MCSTDPALGSKVRWTEKFVIARRVRSRDLRWCAAESAGEWRGDVRRSDTLLGRFFGWHLVVGRWRGASWRINQAAVLDDFLNLRAVERFVFEQRFGDYLELVAIRDERLFRQLISVIEQFFYFLIDLLGCRFAVVARARNVASEENVILVVTIFDHAHFFAHAPFANHPARNRRCHFDVAPRAIGDVPK